jgi:hypothetical protein
MMEERRKTPRLKLEKPVAAKVRTFVSGQMLDVSAGGLLMRVRKPLAVGTVYAMRLVFPDAQVEVFGTVRRCWLAGFDTDEEGDRVRAYNAGLEFDTATPELVGRFRPGDALQIHLEPGEGPSS